MLPAHWPTLQPYIDQALEADEAGRSALLNSLRARDPALAEQLQALLTSHFAATSEGFLRGHGPLAQISGAPQPGQRLGAYTLQQAIGEGGTGSVWRARRDDGRFEGEVAVKLLHHSLVQAGRAERFRREGQILARLAHPHIAHLIDAGVTPSGQPYLVLEHVQGQRIDTYCDAQRLRTAERIALFLSLLDAVAHAHRHLVVHRDIKPGNVMVSEAGVVKLLDFGIAKLLALDDLPEDAAAQLTLRAGAGLTPGYAAPEQWRQGSITTATDVYALGVLLFLLLAGRHPTLSDGDSLAEAVRNTVEQDAPRLSASLPAEPAATAWAAARQSTPAALRRQLHGDLDNIVAKALQREPDARYPGAAALAEDLRRYLAHEPVLARAPSLAYRAGKFMQRHRLPLAVATLGLAGASLLGTVALQQQHAAQLSAARAQSVDGLLQSMFNGLSPDVAASRHFTARELLVHAQGHLDSTPGLDPDTQRATRLRMAGLYREIGAYHESVASYQAEAQEAERRGESRAQVSALWQVANVQLKLLDFAPAGKTLQRLSALVETTSSSDDEWRGRLALLQAERQLLINEPAAAAGFARAQAMLAAAMPDNLELLARAARGRGAAARREGQLAVARAHLLQAAALQRQRGPQATMDGLAVVLDLGKLDNWAGRFDAAVAELGPGRAELLTRVGPQHALSVALSAELAYALLRTGQFAAARAILTELSVAQGPGNAWAVEHAQLLEARAQMYEGHAQQAEASLAERLLTMERKEGGTSSATEPLRRLHAEALLRLNRDAPAEAALQRTAANQTALTHAGHNSVAITQVLLGCAQARRGDLDAARQTWQQASAVLDRDLGPQHPFALVAASYLALADASPKAAAQRQALAQRVQAELGWQDGAASLTQRLRAPERVPDQAPSWRTLPVVM